MNSSKIDVTYEQTHGVCVFASYSIIMNYFSSGKKSISDLMDTYINAFSIPVNNTVMDKETAIHQHYHAYCKNKALRGFQFIADQHKMNRFHTSRYCYPVRVTVNQNNAALNRRHNTLLKRILKKRDGLAMILMENGTHAIVVGFDRRKGGYFF